MTNEQLKAKALIARAKAQIQANRYAFLRKSADRIELLPENPDYQTIVVNPEEPFDTEGLAVGLIRNTLLM